MENITQVAPLKTRINKGLGASDLTAALAAGMRDFFKHPQFGLFFAAIFVAAGLFLLIALNSRSAIAWLIPAIAGFPILAPFAAAGLYELSRKELRGEPIEWRAILTAVRGRGDDQLPFMGVLSFVIFGFWVILAHAIFGIFLGGSNFGADLFAALLSDSGIAMLAVGGIIGALIAFTYFAITVISLPMLIDMHVDFITAIIISLRVVRSNPGTMIGWAIIIAFTLFIAMLPLFLGLFVALPILGHATFHLYRRAVVQD